MLSFLLDFLKILKKLIDSKEHIYVFAIFNVPSLGIGRRSERP